MLRRRWPKAAAVSMLAKAAGGEVTKVTSCDARVFELPLFPNPITDPWDWYIYLHGRLIFMVFM